MVQIVGEDTTVLKRATCRNCGAVLEYRPTEVRELWRSKDISGGPDGADGFGCPRCGADVMIRRW